MSPLIKALDKVGEFNRPNVRFCVSQPDNTHHIYLLRHGSGFIAFECKPGRTFPNLTGTIVLCTTNDAAEIILVGCTHNMARETLEDINIILFGKAKQDRPLHN